MCVERHAFFIRAKGLEWKRAMFLAHQINAERHKLGRRVR